MKPPVARTSSENAAASNIQSSKPTQKKRGCPRLKNSQQMKQKSAAPTSGCFSHTLTKSQERCSPESGSKRIAWSISVVLQISKRLRRRVKMSECSASPVPKLPYLGRAIALSSRKGVEAAVGMVYGATGELRTSIAAFRQLPGIRKIAVSDPFAFAQRPTRSTHHDRVSQMLRPGHRAASQS
jgi:hypothetical protein